MSDSKRIVASGGIGFCGLLTIVLIALKITGATTLSWIWVLGPLWIPPVSIALLIVLFLMVVNR